MFNAITAYNSVDLTEEGSRKISPLPSRDDAVQINTSSFQRSTPYNSTSNSGPSPDPTLHTSRVMDGDRDLTPNILQTTAIDNPVPPYLDPRRISRDLDSAVLPNSSAKRSSRIDLPSEREELDSTTRPVPPPRLNTHGHIAMTATSGPLEDSPAF